MSEVSQVSEPQPLELRADQVQSVNVLIAAAQVAQSKGAFSLADAKSVLEAIQNLIPPPPAQEEVEAAS